MQLPSWLSPDIVSVETGGFGSAAARNREQKMIYREQEHPGSSFPLVVIAIAMVAIVGVLIAISDRPAPTRVWVPSASVGSGASVALSDLR